MPLTFPPAPSAPRRGEQGGDGPSSGDSASFNDAAFTNPITPLPQRGRGARGEGGPHLPPGPLPFPDEESKGEMGLAVAILRLSTIPRSRTQSPLSRSAGRPAPRCQSHDKKFTTQLTSLPQRGQASASVPKSQQKVHDPNLPSPAARAGQRLGAEVTTKRSRLKSPLSRSAGEGPGVRAALTFPPTPFRSHQASGRGRHERSNGDPAPAAVNDTAFTTQLTPLPQRGRGAGGEGSTGEGPGVRAARDRDLPLLDNSPTLWYCSTTLHLREGDISRTIELRDRQSCPAMHSGTDRRLINRLFGIPTVQSNAPAVGT